MTSFPAGFGVVGIGNVLIGDDAIGPYVISLLKSRWEWPETVELIDAGTPGSELAFIIQPFATVVVIDVVNTGAAPGTLVRLGLDALTAPSSAPGRTSHDPGLTAALRQLNVMDDRPREIALVGMTPDPANEGTGLSPAALSALPALLEMIMGELARHGIFPKKREVPLPENIWWEKKL